MRTIAITRADGGLSIMRILDDNAVVATEIAKWAAGGFVAASFQQINESDVPVDRSARNAWEVV